MTDPLADSPFGRFGHRLAVAVTSRTARNTYWLGSSSVVNGLLGALASALLARTLGIEDFGTLTLLLTLVNLLADLSDLGLGSCLVRFGAESGAKGDQPGFRRVLGVVLRLKGGIAVFWILAAVLLQPAFATLFGHVSTRLASYFLIVIIASLLSIAAAVFPPIFQAFGDFRRGAIAAVARPASRVLLIAGVITYGAGLPLTTALWIEAGSIFFALAVGSMLSPVRRFSFRSEPVLRREIVMFTRWVSLHQVITLLGNKLDVFLVGAIADAHTLGIYGAAARVSGLALAVVNSYYTVLLAQVSTEASSAPALARRIAQARLTGILISCGIAGLAALAVPLTTLLYGGAFGEAAPVLQIMCAGIIFSVLAYPVNARLFAENRTAVFPIASLVSAVATIAGNILLVPKFGAIGAALAYAASALLAWLSALVYAGSRRRGNGTH